MASPTIQTLTSFSGADLVATFANKVIGELQQISWAIQRDKAPVFTCGSPDARSFSRGKRGIAGSMVFAVFDHDSLVEGLQSEWDKIAPPAMFTAAGNIGANRYSEDFTNALSMIKWNSLVSDVAAGGDSAGDYGISNENEGNTRSGWGFSWQKDLEYEGAIDAQVAKGSNNSPPPTDENGYLNPYGWGEDGEEIYVPAGFAPIRGENVVYADTLPPSTIDIAA